MSYRKFWKTKPIFRRVFAFFLLITMPIVMPIFYIIVQLPDFIELVKQNYVDTWNVLINKDDSND